MRLETEPEFVKSGDTQMLSELPGVPIHLPVSCLSLVLRLDLVMGGCCLGSFPCLVLKGYGFFTIRPVSHLLGFRLTMIIQSFHVM